MKKQSLAGYEDMVSYYKNLNIVPDEKEFEQFKNILLLDLPITFRLNKTRPYWKEIEKRINEAVEKIKEESGIIPLTKHNIVSEEIFKFEISSQDLKKNPKFNILHKILLEETIQNNVFRQELVSMIPVSLLNVDHKSTYLDMCAAPGSKTLQIVEKVVLSQSQSKDSHVSGYVVANELDSLRSNMLAFQTIKIPQNFMMITNQDACSLPDEMKFDKIVCDVPCSGDGTIRKNDMIKKGWSYKYGLKLHTVQLRILVKGLNLLKEGGELMYSTCSLNPLEDESVVNAALNLFEGSVELVDLKPRMGEFKATPGINQWKVYFKRGKKELNQDWFENYDQVVQMKRQDKITKTMFPSHTENPHPLERTVRILPHQNDTGGFYIALLRKKSNKIAPLPELLTNSEEEKLPEISTTELSDSNKKTGAEDDEESKSDQKDGNELVKFSEKYPESWIKVKKYYSLPDTYDEDLYFLNRGLKRLLYINKPLAELVKNLANTKVRIVSIGNKVLERLRDEECEVEFRVLNESLHWMSNDIKSQIITLSTTQFKDLVTDFDKHKLELKTDDIKHGPFIVSTKARDLSLIGWKGRKRLTLLIGKEEINFLLYLLKYNFYTLE